MCVARSWVGYSRGSVSVCDGFALAPRGASAGHARFDRSKISTFSVRRAFPFTQSNHGVQPPDVTVMASALRSRVWPPTRAVSVQATLASRRPCAVLTSLSVLHLLTRQSNPSGVRSTPGTTGRGRAPPVTVTQGCRLQLVQRAYRMGTDAGTSSRQRKSIISGVLRRTDWGRGARPYFHVTRSLHSHTAALRRGMLGDALRGPEESAGI